MKSLLILAAENGALKGGKAGGVADVVRDLPAALKKQGYKVTVMTPGYGLLGQAEGLAPAGQLDTTFRGEPVSASLLGGDIDGVRHLVVEHPALLGSHPGEIYVHDPTEPFASDASRFALFSALAADYVRATPGIDLVHIHDWHAAMYLVLRRFSAAHRDLKDIPAVFTIHNLAYQGIRPLRAHPSSLFEWFPELLVDRNVIDPRWGDCINLMRAGIRLADRVNTVSPTYAGEITQAGSNGIAGSEGLEDDLAELAETGQLTGILNGCDYEQELPGMVRALPSLLETINRAVLGMMVQDVHARTSHIMALRVTSPPVRTSGQVVVTAVGRLTDQKYRLLHEPVAGRPALHHLLEAMGSDGTFILLASGDAELARFMNETMLAFENFLFVDGFDSALADDLYRSGRLFVMPSSFEPCGISQMLAMRAGQPCLVHHVGGLRDTVKPGTNGWAFSGETVSDQASALVETFRTAFAETARATPTWRKVQKAASAARFSWDQTARAYREQLYGDQV